MRAGFVNQGPVLHVQASEIRGSVEVSTMG